MSVESVQKETGHRKRKSEKRRPEHEQDSGTDQEATKQQGLQAAGAEVLGRADGRAKPGDIVIRPRIASPYRTLYDISPTGLELLETVTFRPDTAVRLPDFDSHAGFYSSGWGLLPYSLDFERRPLELIA